MKSTGVTIMLCQRLMMTAENVLSYAEYFYGNISNVAIYNKVISASTILAHYNKGSS